MARSDAGPARIFINYRRTESSWPTLWLANLLAGQFGACMVFHDVDSIRPGDDFAAEIEKALESCSVLLVLIGPQWLATEGDAGRRLDDPQDWVRLEIETALNRGVRIIPVLVDGARMPTAEELPPSLRGLVRRQAVSLSSANPDTRSLVSVLETVPMHDAARHRDYRKAMAGLVRNTPDVPLRGTSAPSAVAVFVQRSSEPERPPFPAAELARAEGDCWLVGGPGAGKSRQLREWTLRLCEDPDIRAEAPIPLLVRAPDLLAYIRSPSGHFNDLPYMVARAVNAALKGADREEMPWLEEFLRSQSAADPPWLLLVDGLDEVPDERSRNQVLRQLKKGSTEMSWRCRTVVASRPTGNAMEEIGRPEGGRTRPRRISRAGPVTGTNCWPSAKHNVTSCSVAGLTSSG